MGIKAELVLLMCSSRCSLLLAMPAYSVVNGKSELLLHRTVEESANVRVPSQLAAVMHSLAASPRPAGICRNTSHFAAKQLALSALRLSVSKHPVTPSSDRLFF
jgi:hypothetical protein